MSVYVSAYVWEHSAHKGTDLLLMLAIADIAHKNGCAFPSVATLARFIRMSERNTQRVLQKLEESGELKIKRNAGPKGTHVFQVAMNVTLPLFSGGDKLSPDILTGDSRTLKGVTDAPFGGDRPTSPEPVEPKANRKDAARATPSPVAACFKAYADGIKASYGADYPPSAKANGQLSNIVARVGAEPALAVIGGYFASSNAFYAKVKHSLDYLVKDCERLWLDLQVASGQAAPKPATHALVQFLKADGALYRDLGRQGLGSPEDVARRAIKEYSRFAGSGHTKHVAVIIGRERRVFSIEELSAVHA